MKKNLRKLIVPAALLFATSAGATTWYVNDNNMTGDVYTTAVGNDGNSGSSATPFASITHAIAMASNGDVIFVDAGTYNEQVLVNKEVSIKNLIGPKPIINFTGVSALVSGKKTEFEIVSPNVTIEGLDFEVNVTNIGSAIVASSATLNNLTVRNNNINPYRSAPTTVAFGLRNAININYGAYRLNSVNPVVLIHGNIITYNYGVDNTPGTADDAGFRDGIATDEGGGTFTLNTIQSISQDIEARFGGAGDINVTNNNINGGGVDLADYNAGAGNITVTGNTFNGTFGSSYTSALRLLDNQENKVTVVSGNTFTGHNWGISLENYKNVSINNNTFTPLANSTTYHHITVNTKVIATSSSVVLQIPIDATIINNTFNVSGTLGGTALGFYNHDNDNASFGTFVIGSLSNENNFNAGIAKVIYLDSQTGTSSGATFPAYTSIIGAGAGSLTTMAYWTPNLDARNNKYDMGAGLQLPTVLSLTNLFSLGDKITHSIDASGLGYVMVKANNDYVTMNSFVSPATTVASIQRGIDAASAGYTVNVNSGSYNEDITVNKQVTLMGAGMTSTTISGPIGGSTSAISVAASNVIIDGFTITRDGNNTTDWNNPNLNTAGISIQGQTNNAEIRNNQITGNRTGIDINNSNGNNIHNNTITSNRTGLVFRNQTDSTLAMQNFITNNWTVGILFLDASGGTNIPVQSALNSDFSSNDLSGNWYGEIVDRQAGGSLPTPGTTNMKNFTCNWFGSNPPTVSTANSTEPGYAAQIPVAYGGTAAAPGGQPEILGLGSANFVYSPFLTSGTDLGGNANNGFQPSMGCSLLCNAAPATPGSISGPSVVCGMTDAVYSIAAVATATSYTWTVPTGANGMTILSGQGTTSINVHVLGGPVGDITATATNSCGTSSSSNLYVTFKPQQADTIYGPVTVCNLNTANYSISALYGATSYVWNVPAGMTVTSGAGTTAITVAIASTFVSGKIQVTGINNCGYVPGKTLFVTGSAPLKPVSISGPTRVCGMSTATYSIPSFTNVTGYNWTVSGIGTIIGSNTGTSVTVALNGGSGSISAAAVNACGTGAYKTLAVTTGAAQPGLMTGPSNLCGMTTATYSVPSLGAGYTYTWSLAVTSWTITSGQGTSSITVTGPATGTSGSGIVKVRSSNTCNDTSAYRSTGITYCHTSSAMFTLTETGANTISAVYPNPTSSEFKIDVTTDVDEVITVQVYDVIGNLIINEKHQMTKGTSTLTNSISNYEAGMYFVRLIDNDANTIYSQTLVKQ